MNSICGSNTDKTKDIYVNRWEHGFENQRIDWASSASADTRYVGQAESVVTEVEQHCHKVLNGLAGVSDASSASRARTHLNRRDSVLHTAARPFTQCRQDDQHEYQYQHQHQHQFQHQYQQKRNANKRYDATELSDLTDSLDLSFLLAPDVKQFQTEDFKECLRAAGVNLEGRNGDSDAALQRILRSFSKNVSPEERLGLGLGAESLRAMAAVHALDTPARPSWPDAVLAFNLFLALMNWVPLMVNSLTEQQKQSDGTSLSAAMVSDAFLMTINISVGCCMQLLCQVLVAMWMWAPRPGAGTADNVIMGVANHVRFVYCLVELVPNILLLCAVQPTTSLEKSYYNFPFTPSALFMAVRTSQWDALSSFMIFVFSKYLPETPLFSVHVAIYMFKFSLFCVMLKNGHFLPPQFQSARFGLQIFSRVSCFLAYLVYLRGFFLKRRDMAREEKISPQTIQGTKSALMTIAFFLNVGFCLNLLWDYMVIFAKNSTFKDMEDMSALQCCWVVIGKVFMVAALMFMPITLTSNYAGVTRRVLKKGLRDIVAADESVVAMASADSAEGDDVEGQSDGADDSEAGSAAAAIRSSWHSRDDNDAGLQDRG